ncbi:EamA family transporter [Sutterella wadsworthensis]|uniref:EamA family transporter n=1 Tax=Sutterella wadsworthensis TaxID=40545 RepID=UPI003078E9CC
MFIGIIFGIIACALWGLVYIIPLWLSTYDPMLIALARYTIFGLFSAVLLFFNGKYLSQVSKKDWISATALGVVGNLFFYWLLASAVQLAGAPIAGAFTAVIPISVALWQILRPGGVGQEYPGAVSFSRSVWWPPVWFASTGQSLATSLQIPMSPLQDSGWVCSMHF